MLKPLIRTGVFDGTVAADSANGGTALTNYVGGCPGAMAANGVYGALSDTRYCGVMVNSRAIDVANGNAVFAAGTNKLQIWRGISGTDVDSNTASDAFCPFDVTVTWAIGDNLYIRSMTTYAIWSNFNYNSGQSHGFVTSAPASASDRLEGWFMDNSQRD